MAVRIIVTFLGLALIVGILAGVKVSQFQAMAAMGESMSPPSEVISTVPVQATQWEQIRRSVGTLEAKRGVMITAELTGRVDQILFDSGAVVEKGALLIEQNIETEAAQLRSAEASLALAKANLKRSKDLFKKRVVSQSQLDAADAEYKAAQAQVENARVTLERKSIRAPFKGKLGIRQVNVGEDLAPNQPIVSLQTSDPMLVNFSLPQKDLSVTRLGLEVRLQSDAVPGRVYKGTITAINPEVNARSRNVLIQATLANEDGLLLPGMFASVDIVMPEKRQVTYVPLTAIQYATFGDSVFVIESENSESGETTYTAQQQFVQLGQSQGDYIEILKGLTEGQVVASAGLFKIRNGAPVAINNDIAPSYEQSPNPLDR